MMFYERQQNFGFPITTTTADGAIVTKQLKAPPGQPGKQSGLDGLTRLNADIKTG